MRRKFIIVLFILSGFTLSAATGNREWFAKGNEFYSDGQYDSSLYCYHRILESGSFSSEVYYNLGNTYYRKGEIGLSILYYEKALVLSPDDPDIQANLAKAESEKKDSFEEIPRPQLELLLKKVVAVTSFNNWFIMALSLLAIASVLLVVFLKREKRKTWMFASYLGLILVSAVLFGLGFFGFQVDRNAVFGIVVTPNAYIKSEPESGKDLYIIHEGSKVKIEDRFNDWTKIRLLDGKSGWVEKEKVEEI